ncbi:MAG TPA: hypothetical protein VJV79_29590 [Polyangiaceae bacterium]|nr:hypothetical protein [Polyangiaceae bacterium]
MVLRQNGHGLGWAIVCAAVLANACAGKSSVSDGGQSGNGSAAGGASDGGASASGGAISDGGASANAGKGAATSGGAGQASRCEGVLCAAIPATCTKIVQGPNDCCPTCPDTGCDLCQEPNCEPGTHAEVIAGDCCATCIADPPDACAKGQEQYETMRSQLYEKYSSSGCKNSAECELAIEDNACSRSCPLVLPAQSVDNYLSNLNNAASGCATCAEQPQPKCISVVAACVNGKCLAVDAK